MSVLEVALAMTTKQDRFHEYARMGAQVRASELQAEINEIYRAFPELRGSTRGGVRKSSTTPSPNGVAAVAAETPAKRRRAPQWSAAARKAVSQRMKKYWAERRRAKS